MSKPQWLAGTKVCLPVIESIDWCYFYYFVRNSLVALLEALCAEHNWEENSEGFRALPQPPFSRIPCLYALLLALFEESLMLIFSLAIATGSVKHEPKNWKIESFDHIYNSYTVSACTIELKVSSRGAVPRRACCSSASTRAPSLCDRTCISKILSRRTVKCLGWTYHGTCYIQEISIKDRDRDIDRDRETNRDTHKDRDTDTGIDIDIHMDKYGTYRHTR